MPTASIRRGMGAIALPTFLHKRRALSGVTSSPRMPRISRNALGDSTTPACVSVAPTTALGLTLSGTSLQPGDACTTPSGASVQWSGSNLVGYNGAAISASDQQQLMAAGWAPNMVGAPGTTAAGGTPTTTYAIVGIAALILYGLMKRS
jgi:hypothetical protein